MDVLAFIALLIGLVFLSCIACFFEYRDFNKGICRYCKTELRLFDMDSQGGRGYVCDKCGYCTWISYNIVDRKFEEDKK